MLTKISRKKVVASFLQVCWLRQELKVWQSLSVWQFMFDFWIALCVMCVLCYEQGLKGNCKKKVYDGSENF